MMAKDSEATHETKILQLIDNWTKAGTTDVPNTH
jgi:hypothetical protein